MPITSVDKDTQALTMTVVASFPVPLRRLWDAYADPRQIEKFWGPVGWPATFTRHDVAPGGQSRYYMSGPEGEVSGGYWEFLSVNAPHSFEVLDGFTGDDGEPNRDMPTIRMVFSFEETPDGSRVTTTSHFNSVAELEQLLEMGMEEGLASAMSQIDEVLADLSEFAAEREAHAQMLSDTKVRVSRVVRGTPEQVWRAHHEPELMKQWMLGPDGWSMPVCEMGENVGDSYRFEWVDANGENRFGFTGEVLESHRPYRAVTTERMTGMEGPSTVNELTFTPVEGGTLVSTVITYPDRETRDMVLETGMVGGMESSYDRLEREVLAAA